MRIGRRIALILAIWALPTSARAAPAAVVPLLSVNLSVDDTDRLTDNLAGALTEARGERVRGGRPIRRLLPEEDLPADCPVTPACIERLGAIVEAETLVFVVITRVGDQVQVDPTVVGETSPGPATALRGRWSDLQQPAWWRGRVDGWLASLPARPVTVAGAPAVGWPAPGWSTWTLASVSVVSLAVGIGFGVSAQNAADGLEADGCLDRPCPDGDIDAVADRARVADALYVVSGVSAVGAILSYVFFDQPSPPVAVSAGPGGVSVVGRF